MSSTPTSGRTGTADTTGRATERTPNRWIILAGGILVQLAIGGVYAWSTFAKAFQSPDSALRLSKVEAAIPFELCIGMIFVGAFLGGRIQDRRGPRVVALTGVVIYAIGILLSSFARDAGQLWLLILGYGLISGFGLGLAYIVPIAMLQKWFPDKAGLITGLAVGGFGFGAVLTSPVAQSLIGNDKVHPAAPFLPLGIAYLVAGVIGAMTFANPPKGYRPPGAPDPALATEKAPGTTPAAAATPARGGATEPVGTVALQRDFSQAEALRTLQWYLLTAILTLSVTAGISLISVAASAASDVAGYSAAAAASLVGLMGLFNGGGRILWGWVSDRIGKMLAFVAILAIQGLCLIALPHASSVAVFAILSAVIYTCYGGGFGTMPSTAGKFFGVSNAGGIYGLMLIGWSIGGVAGPLIASALIGSSKNYTMAFTVVGIIALVGAVVPFITKAPQKPSALDDRPSPSV
ncbi:L-lactate MFS transporter [Arsenicicoccus piscis]|uniref:MFS transporter n=1 Tax=Arsenicicoccus piscis TaxID=673954 RepID=A0ABQ6HL23_9MICO|nr:OFA family MFS transporter [Arsenicicoccus piscis]GMA19149.1 MFS transporter [Arsenicicoccus piscis]